MTEYVKDFFPKPFIEDIIKGNCLPIIGAGFSLNANIPAGKKMLQWDDLGRHFADYIPNYVYTNPLDAISAYCHEFSRNSLLSKLSDALLVDSINPGDAHKAFSKLPFKLICTTNFDFLLEKAIPFSKPITDESQLSISIDESTIGILKIHGDLNHPNLIVATEEDYDLFLERRPLLSTYLSYLLIVKTPLFIGYSIDDPDFRQIFKVVNDRLGDSKRPAYTIKLNASNHEVAKFERRGVKVINIKDQNTTYERLFVNVFEELSAIWQKGVLQQSTFTQTDMKAELITDDLSQNRLCFFSIPFKFIPYYREVVFPVIKKYGFIPITADEVISYGDTIIAKVSALIQKAEIVIVDASDSNNNVMYELSVALNQHGKRILVISDDEHFIKDRNLNSRIVHVVKKSDDNYDNSDMIRGIEKWISNITKEFYGRYNKEPARLLEKNEYRAAVVSIFSLLEIELGKAISKNYSNNDVRMAGLHQMTKMIYDWGVVAKNEYDSLRKWLMVRNKIVHDTIEVDRITATEIVEGISAVISKLKGLELKE